MPATLYFWKAEGPLQLTPERIAEELHYGEDVAGLIDLPIDQVIAQFKQAFSQTREHPGLLQVLGTEGPFALSWSWQYFRIDGEQLNPADRERCAQIGRQFGCEPFEP